MFLSSREKEMEKQRYMRMLKLLILFICMSVRELYSLTQTIHSLSEEDSLSSNCPPKKFPVEVVISIDRLEEIEVHENSNLTCTNLSGSNIKVFSSSNGLIHFENLLCENLQVRHEGAGNIFLLGRKITKLQAHLHGSGSFQAGDLPVDEAIISHHGNGLLEISPEHVGWMLE